METSLETSPDGNFAVIDREPGGEARLDGRATLFLVLACVFVVCLVVGDIIGGKLIQVVIAGHPFTLTVGMIPFPVTFLLTDLLNEFYGKAAARRVTVIGFGMAVLAFIFIAIAGAIPIAPMAQAPGWTGVTEAAFANVFLGSQRMIVASLSAYLIAQFTDIGVFHLLKRVTGGRLLWLRATGSTIASQLIDTLTVNLVAWIGVLSASDIVNVVISSYILKVGIAVSLTPAIYIGHAAIERWLGMRPIAVGAAS